jgi:hypothetical protein
MRPSIRWYALGGGIAAAALAAAAAAFILLRPTPEEGPPLEGAAWLPPSTLAYLELDLEPDGAQADALAELARRLAPLGGAAAGEAVLDPLFGALSNDRYTYTADVRPWTTGHAAIALLSFPDFRDPQPGSGLMPGIVLLVGVADRDGADGLVARLREDREASGATSETRTHGSVPIWVSRDELTPEGVDGLVVALADDMLIAGIRLADVTAALDAHDAEALSGTQAFRDAIRELPPDRIGTYWTVNSPERLVAELLIGGGLGVSEGPAATRRFLESFLPSTQVGAVMVAGDRLVLERQMGRPQFVAQPPAADSPVPGHLPPDVAGYLELPAVGATLDGLLSSIDQDLVASGSPGLAVLGAQAGIPVARIGDLFGDAGLAFTLTDGQPAAGLVAQVDDPVAVDQLIGRLQALMQIGGTRPRDYRGVTIRAGSLPFIFGGEVPFDIAIHEGWLVMGGGPGFVEASLDAVLDGDSLASSPRFSELIEAADAQVRAGLLYLDNEALLRGLVQVPGQTQTFEQILGPRLAVGDAALLATIPAEDHLVSRLVVLVNPAPEAPAAGEGESICAQPGVSPPPDWLNRALLDADRRMLPLRAEPCPNVISVAEAGEAAAFGWGDGATAAVLWYGELTNSPGLTANPAPRAAYAGYLLRPGDEVNWFAVDAMTGEHIGGIGPLSPDHPLRQGFTPPGS